MRIYAVNMTGRRTDLSDYIKDLELALQDTGRIAGTSDNDS